jgi:hypothetical protein
MIANERILKTLENGINRLKKVETNAELYAILRTIAAVAKQESKRVFIEMDIKDE